MFRKILQTFKYCFFPSKCLACGRLFHQAQRHVPEKSSWEFLRHDPMKTVFHRVMTPFFCHSCQTDFSPILPPFCDQCGRMFDSKSTSTHRCGNCIEKPPSCRTIRSAGIYSGALKSAIHDLKYKRKGHLGQFLGQLLFSSFVRYYDTATIDCIIPVPLHRSRLKQRGFNQAHMLIDQWPVLFKTMDCGQTIHTDYNNLVRKRKTMSQTGLGKKKRKQNVKGAFAVIDQSRFCGKHLLLVDDVYTTGSTCNECAKTLIAGGAASISALTLARADG